ncbi:MAG: hypothetical protein KFH87_06210 [Bacteroidetes bacterium]|nr:hypothetical protein [Bacteroidota bacterium]
MIHTHPAATADYHRLFLDHLRPALIERLHDNTECFLVEDREDPASSIYDTFEAMPTSRWEFMLMDADDPCIPGFDPPWFYRGTVECNRMHMMVQSDFYLCLHPSIGFRRVRSLLADPAFMGLPPAMSIETDIDGNESWTVKFHHGTGIGWQGLSPDSARNYFLAVLEDTLDVFRAARIFSRDYRDATAFRSLRTVLRTAFEAM